MMIDLQKQAERFGTDVRFGYATKCEFSTDGSLHKIEIDGSKTCWLKPLSFLLEQQLNG